MLKVNGASIHLAEHGDGPSHRVITPDSRGHGQSTNPSEHLSYAAIADDVAAIISSLGLERPVVGGWSDGGQVAASWATLRRYSRPATQAVRSDGRR